MRSRTGLVALVTVVLAAAAACGPGTADRSGSSAVPPEADHHVMRLAGAIAAPTSPKQVRAGFEQLLGLHTLLAVRQMRNVVVAAAPDLGQAASASLQQNTDGLSRLVASVYGGTQADRFTKLWQRHLGDLSAYAKGVAGKNTSATQTARAALLVDADAYGSWLAGASKGRARHALRRPGCGCMSRSSCDRPTLMRPATTPRPTGSRPGLRAHVHRRGRPGQGQPDS